MAEPITTFAASTLATLACQKFLESGTGELAKQFTGAAIAKMDELRQKIWDKLRGTSPKVDEALTNVEQGDREALATIAKNVDVAMDEDPTFAADLQAIAQVIHAGKLLDQSTMTMHVSGHAKGWQTKLDGGTAYIGEVHIHEKPSSSDG